MNSSPEPESRLPLTLIVAMTPDGLIGLDGKIPWRIPEDLRRFRALTTSHAIIMGRKTFDSIGKALPNRKNIVVSRDVTLKIDGVFLFSNIADAIAEARRDDASPFVIGGGEIYAAALPDATLIEATIVGRSEYRFFDVESSRTLFPLTLSDIAWDFRQTRVEDSGVPGVDYMTFARR